MQLPKRIFVYEFITGGGMVGEPLPDSLTSEGDEMLRALLQDLAELSGLELLTLRDGRLGQLPGALPCLRVDSVCGLDLTWSRAIAWADAVWPIAPESDGTLQRLSQRIMDAGRRLLGSRPDAVETAASKLRTSVVLAQAGVPVVYTQPLAQGLPQADHGWVIKPDDGAGSEEIHFITRPDTLAGLALPVAHAWVVQPYIEGTALSLSVLYDGRTTQVLSCNVQHIEHAAGRLRLRYVNTLDGRWRGREFDGLAGQVCGAIPGLRGYVGIDLQMTDAGPVVIEVNPRLTTAYAGLSRRLGMNVAASILAAGGWED